MNDTDRRSARHHSPTLSVGLGGPKDSLAVAYVAQEHGAAGTSLGTVGTRHVDSDHLVRTLRSTAKHLVCVSEAGPWGSWLSRYLTQKGSDCWVVAPSLIPKKAGARAQTDRRDAGPRARLMRSGDLPPVYVPTVADDAIRELCRARADTLRDLNAAKLRLQAF